MKKSNIHILILFLATFSVITSCEKWLDVQPTTKLDRSELLKTEAGYATALAGVYSNMTSTSLYGRELTYGVMDVLAGYYYPANSNPTTYYKFYRDYPYKRNNSSKDDACVNTIDAMWKGMYNTIANLNSVIGTIDENKSVFSEDNYRILKGEAIGLRAFLHLDLLRMYGPSYVADPAEEAIPYVDSLSSVVYPLLTVEEACNKIISELTKALSLMENDPIKSGKTPSSVLASAISTTTLPGYHNRKYHFNYYAVEATLARAYLWKGDKTNALKYAKAVIADQTVKFPWVLDANISSINTSGAANKDRTFTTEHIFALNIRNLESVVPSFLSSAGTDGGNLLYCKSSTRNTIYENSTVDPRSQYLFVANGSSYFFPTKLYQEVTSSTWFKYQMPLIRVSEMYYIAAECEPNVFDGLTWLNTVRTARKLGALTSSAVSSAGALQEQIRKEYQKEFICEGQLWFYYKRLNLTSLPLTYNFDDRTYYVFDMPENEYLYGGRK